jgi:signal transduction histidine kinase
MELIDPGDLVQDSVDALRAHCGAYGVTLALEIEQALPRVEADPTRIREVISNLVTNAIRYTPAGGQIIVRGTSRRDPAGIQVSVQDSGSGIDPAELPHIFERFYKSSESSGSGLGLAISRGLVHAHHGQISAESSLGQGTCITFWLPAAG